ncbi:hypothetical protein CXG81DRAFT_26331 [Caulochytrium protostelioides]|uniref:Uncharacterized protein n=1 Tax=Caulochytrium protostelioides TaxID=1555241 RepID=A0A4P9X6Y7_9FUNG|nr:hypothetical protein CXG81DRAFT_26331 [Caulochytrium protostelioides]|eukprot:RKP00974.1 hypothetical protein CXG81DRAFT_26331 [Caulochytrium protostelioides]
MPVPVPAPAPVPAATDTLDTGYVLPPGAAEPVPDWPGLIRSDRPPPISTRALFALARGAWTPSAPWRRESVDAADRIRPPWHEPDPAARRRALRHLCMACLAHTDVSDAQCAWLAAASVAAPAHLNGAAVPGPVGTGAGAATGAATGTTPSTSTPAGVGAGAGASLVLTERQDVLLHLAVRCWRAARAGWQDLAAWTAPVTPHPAGRDDAAAGTGSGTASSRGSLSGSSAPSMPHLERASRQNGLPLLSTPDGAGLVHLFLLVWIQVAALAAADPPPAPACNGDAAEAPEDRDADDALRAAWQQDQLAGITVDPHELPAALACYEAFLLARHPDRPPGVSSTMSVAAHLAGHLDQLTAAARAQDADADAWSPYAARHGAALWQLLALWALRADDEALGERAHQQAAALMAVACRDATDARGDHAFERAAALVTVFPWTAAGAPVAASRLPLGLPASVRLLAAVKRLRDAQRRLAASCHIRADDAAAPWVSGAPEAVATDPMAAALLVQEHQQARGDRAAVADRRLDDAVRATVLRVMQPEDDPDAMAVDDAPTSPPLPSRPSRAALDMLAAYVARRTSHILDVVAGLPPLSSSTSLATHETDSRLVTEEAVAHHVARFLWTALGVGWSSLLVSPASPATPAAREAACAEAMAILPLGWFSVLTAPSSASQPAHAAAARVLEDIRTTPGLAAVPGLSDFLMRFVETLESWYRVRLAAGPPPPSVATDPRRGDAVPAAETSPARTAPSLMADLFGTASQSAITQLITTSQLPSLPATVAASGTAHDMFGALMPDLPSCLAQENALCTLSSAVAADIAGQLYAQAVGPQSNPVIAAHLLLRQARQRTQRGDLTPAAQFLEIVPPALTAVAEINARAVEPGQPLPAAAAREHAALGHDMRRHLRDLTFASLLETLAVQDLAATGATGDIPNDIQQITMAQPMLLARLGGELLRRAIWPQDDPRGGRPLHVLLMEWTRMLQMVTTRPMMAMQLGTPPQIDATARLVTIMGLINTIVVHARRGGGGGGQPTIDVLVGQQTRSSARRGTYLHALLLDVRYLVTLPPDALGHLRAAAFQLAVAMADPALHRHVASVLANTCSAWLVDLVGSLLIGCAATWSFGVPGGISAALAPTWGGKKLPTGLAELLGQLRWAGTAALLTCPPDMARRAWPGNEHVTTLIRRLSSVPVTDPALQAAMAGPPVPGMPPPGMAPPGMAPPGMAPPGMNAPGRANPGALAQHVRTLLDLSRHIYAAALSLPVVESRTSDAAAAAGDAFAMLAADGPPPAHDTITCRYDVHPPLSNEAQALNELRTALPALWHRLAGLHGLRGMPTRGLAACIKGLALATQHFADDTALQALFAASSDHPTSGGGSSNSRDGEGILRLAVTLALTADMPLAAAVLMQSDPSGIDYKTAFGAVQSHVKRELQAPATAVEPPLYFVGPLTPDDGADTPSCCLWDTYLLEAAVAAAKPLLSKGVEGDPNSATAAAEAAEIAACRALCQTLTQVLRRREMGLVVDHDTRSRWIMAVRRRFLRSLAARLAYQVPEVGLDHRFLVSAPAVSSPSSA